jgi:pseudouridylate synthase
LFVLNLLTPHALIAGRYRASPDQSSSGKPLTPFLLDSIRQATFGRGLRANCALLIANARLAAEVAEALLDLYGKP